MLHIAPLIVASVVADKFIVPSVSHASLVRGDEAVSAVMRAALIDSGMISVTGIPGYAELRKTTLARSDTCGASSHAAQSHTYSDGTTRRTMATHSISGPGGAQPIKHEDNTGNHCASFDVAANRFRETVSSTTNTFAERLSALLHLDSPVLVTSTGFSFPTFAEVAKNSEHLEHFHSYTRPTMVDAAEPETIAMHTDQGIFIAFTPPLMLRDGKLDKAAHAGDFFIERPDGSRTLVRFEEDALIFMLGDGIHQVVDHKRTPDTPSIRATPHALVAPVTAPNAARLWYGRMVLAPHLAISPAHAPKTFGQIREGLVKATRTFDDSADALSLGCSSHGSHAKRALQTEAPSCAAGTMFCWNRCMNTTIDKGVIFNLSPSTCAAQGKELKCTDVLDRVYNPSFSAHGDYFPACTTSTTLVESGFPTLPNYPRDDAVCSTAAWSAFASTSGYALSYPLGDNGLLLWNIVGGVGQRRIQAKMVYNGLFGWLSFGLRSPTGSKNGMQGAWVAMAQPGGGYTLTGGLNLSLPGSVREYKIHHSQSRYRFWAGSAQTASGFGGPVPVVTQHLTNSAYEATDCFSSFEFTSGQIGEQAFNFDGSDHIVWAASTDNQYVEYHRGDRGVVTIDWLTGGAPFTAYPPPPPVSAPPTMPVALPSALSRLTDGEVIGLIIGIAVATLLLGVFVGVIAKCPKPPASKIEEPKMVSIDTIAEKIATTSSTVAE